ncbi:hypothetical protein J4463_00375 [Candidatus Pacearchaeota archaeon]|nr:hypothetical protein [Candidatus Pacearchaeota archaeon]
MSEKTRVIEVYEKSGGFASVFRKFVGAKSDYNTQDLSILRKLLSNEKARLLNIVKTKEPKSIYELAKILERDFKSVRDDIVLLKKFGFIDLVEGHSGKRKTHKPILTANSVTIVVRI